MANTEKNNINPQSYIKVGGKKVATTEEQARAHMRSRWAEHKRREREQKCLDEKGRQCTTDCSTCDKDKQSRFISLDAQWESGGDFADPFNMDDFVANQILLQELAKALDELDPQNRKIAELVGLGFSEREISTEVGLSQKGVNKRKVKIFDQLREKLKHYR